MMRSVVILGDTNRQTNRQTYRKTDRRRVKHNLLGARFTQCTQVML